MRGIDRDAIADRALVERRVHTPRALQVARFRQTGKHARRRAIGDAGHGIDEQRQGLRNWKALPSHNDHASEASAPSRI